MPPWARWLVELGTWLRSGLDDESHPVVAISAPTRAWAAVLVAVGAHDAGVALADPVSVDEAMELVAGWGEGASVGFDFRGKRREGSIVEVTTDYIYVVSGTDTCGVPRSRVLSIDLLPDGAVPSQRARRLPSGASLRSRLYPTDPLNRIGSSRVECLVIGPKGQIADELATEVQAGDGTPTATIGDVIRPCSLMPAKRPFRTEIVPSGTHELPAYLRSRPPKSIVLDGAGATLDWLDRIAGAPVLVILDRAEARSEDAAAIVLGHRASRRRPRQLDGLAAPPPAIEVVAYEGRGHA